jgi:lambda family phage portal protein
MGLLTKSVQDGLALTVRKSPAPRFNASTAYHAASSDRLNQDWARALLSPDQEIRTSLRALRSRSRSLAINNEHAIRFLRASGEQVVGSEGVSLEMTFADDEFSGAKQFNVTLEKAWERFWKYPTADQKMSGPAATRLWLVTVLADGEAFVQKIKGYPYNDSNFALQFIDADQVDINLQRLRRPNDPSAPNEIRMGVEVDQYRRVIAYHIYEGHPSEFAGVVRTRVPASEMDQAFVFLRANQSRGVPWIAPAMIKMHMVGEYDFAELTASRWAACKMAYFVSKVGEDGYSGGDDADKDGDIEITAEPGSMEVLPEGIEPKVVDWQHPSQNYESFSLAALRGIAAGINCSYATLTGDLRGVNFSSIRQGILSERDGWSVLQGFTIERFCWPVFKSWLPMAILTGQIQLPPRMTYEDVFDHVLWTPRGWDWVDPNKDVQASITAIRSGLSTYQKECAKRGLDWRKVFRQRAAENELAEELGLALDLSTSGGGGVEDDAEDESASTSKGKGALQ